MNTSIKCNLISKLLNNSKSNETNFYKFVKTIIIDTAFKKMFNKTNISRKNAIPFLFAFLFFKTVEISQQNKIN